MKLSQLNESVGKILLSGTNTQVETFTKVLTQEHKEQLIEWLETYDGKLTTEQEKINKDTRKKEVVSISDYFNPKSKGGSVNIIKALLGLRLDIILSLVVEFIMSELTMTVYNDEYKSQLGQMKIDPLQWKTIAA